MLESKTVTNGPTRKISSSCLPRHPAVAYLFLVRPSIHMTTKHRIFTTSFASVYPHYVAKAEKKGRKKLEVDAVICWLTGYNQRELEGQLKKQKDFETFFKE